MRDEHKLIDAIETAGFIIAQHLDPNQVRDPERNINRLIAVLDTQDLARAIQRLKGRHGLHVVK
jgi:hypothetical protein